MQMQAADILAEDSGPKACVVRLSDEIAEVVQSIYPGCLIEVTVSHTAERRWSAIAWGIIPGHKDLLDVVSDASIEGDPTVPGFQEFAEGGSFWHAYLALEARILNRVCPERIERKTVEVPRVDVARLPRKTLRIE